MNSDGTYGNHLGSGFGSGGKPKGMNSADVGRRTASLEGRHQMQLVDIPDDPARYKPTSICGANVVEAVAPIGKVVAYARYSTTLQNGSSIERQFQNIEAYAASRGLDIDCYFDDRGISGTSSERAGLDEVCDVVTKYPGSIVIIENFDRLSRDIPEYGRIKGIFDKVGTKIHDSGGHNTPLVEIIKAGIAADDRHRLLERSAAGKIAAAERGQLFSSRPAYGYRRNKDGLEIDPETAPNVQLIFELRASGLNFKQITDVLHERGIKAPVSDEWSGNTVRNVLRNVIYVGWIVRRLSKPAGHH